jgi:ribonuclease-3
MDFNKNIALIEKKIGYSFKDRSLLTQAFTRSSFCNENKGAKGKGYISNEVLEFFGDSVLSTAIISMMLRDKTERYEHGVYTKMKEGDFSNIRSKLSDKRNLSKSMAALGLQKYLLMGEGDEKLGIENEPSVMEDLFESIIGAVYIDCGMDILRVITVVSGMLDVSVYFSEEAAPIQSYKNALQEWCADKKRRLPAPIYKTVSESGPDHKRVYERAVIIGDRTVATGKGKNQKIADSAAAEAALDILKKEEKVDVNVNYSSLSALKSLASKNKQPSPEFRDLGESATSTVSCREYVIECRSMGVSATATGKSKQEARALAAEKVLAILTPKKQAEPKKTSKRMARPAGKVEVSKSKPSAKIPGAKRRAATKKEK